MSYVRPATKDELIQWLESIDYEALTTEDLAEALVEKFDLVGFFKNLPN